MLKQLGTSIMITLALLVIVCGVYPFVVWGIGQVAFPHQANGSLVANNQGRVVGSALLAQGFTQPQYFQPRPSAAGNGYDPTASGGTNLGPTSDKLIHGAKGFPGVQQLAQQYRQTNGLPPNALVPVDAVTRSASGLDPEISMENAHLQEARVAQARGISLTQVQSLVTANTDGRGLGFLGEPGVNVLRLNLALDKEYPKK